MKLNKSYRSVTQARKILKNFGWNSYPSNGKWNVYSNHGYDGNYSNIELIHLANSIRKTKWKNTYRKIDTHNINCPCCTKSNPHNLRKWSRKHDRRQIVSIIRFELNDIDDI